MSLVFDTIDNLWVGSSVCIYTVSQCGALVTYPNVWRAKTSWFYLSSPTHFLFEVIMFARSFLFPFTLLTLSNAFTFTVCVYATESYGDNRHNLWILLSPIALSLLRLPLASMKRMVDKDLVSIPRQLILSVRSAHSFLFQFNNVTNISTSPSIPVCSWGYYYFHVPASWIYKEPERYSAQRNTCVLYYTLEILGVLTNFIMVILWPESTFDNPCTPKPNGFDTGLQSTGSVNSNTGSAFNLLVCPPDTFGTKISYSPFHV